MIYELHQYGNEDVGWAISFQFYKLTLALVEYKGLSEHLEFSISESSGVSIPIRPELQQIKASSTPSESNITKPFV